LEEEEEEEEGEEEAKMEEEETELDPADIECDLILEDEIVPLPLPPALPTLPLRRADLLLDVESSPSTLAGSE
jgi:hypothetical protein